jgi:hypothetical protein
VVGSSRWRFRSIPLRLIRLTQGKRTCEVLTNVLDHSSLSAKDLVAFHR